MHKNVSLVAGQMYHIFNKSIAGYQIFNDFNDYARMLQLIQYYQIANITHSFSDFCKLDQVGSMGFDYCFYSISDGERRLVDIVTFCLMPTHFHLVLRQVTESGISTYMSNLQNSYTRYFNLKHKRKGPLWVGRFGRRLIETDEDLLHLSRYIHLNPTTAKLVEKPEQWEHSSYREYLKLVGRKCVICKEWQEIIDINSDDYKKFVEEYIGSQRDLAAIKHLVME